MKQREATISRSEMTDGFGPPQVLPPPHARGPGFAQHRPMKQRGEGAGRGETTGSLMTEAQWFSLRSSSVKRMRITRNLSLFFYPFFLFFTNYARGRQAIG